MDEIPYYLYLRDIAGEDISSARMQALKESILSNDWVSKVVADQWSDGSWGRFHSLSSSSDSDFTTERAMRRLLNLGLTKDDEPIKKALNYMELYLHGEINLRDRVEKRHDWTLLTRLFVITWIRLFDKENKIANAEAQKWAQVVSEGFVGGAFNQSIYEEAYLDILKPETRKSIWGVQNFYIVALLPGLLTNNIENSFLDFIMSEEKGIYYIYDGSLKSHPKEFKTKLNSRFLTAHELLSSYSSYNAKSKDTKEWLLNNRNEDGLWDLGSKSKDGIISPLSQSWRSKANREIDCSIRVLRLLKKM